MSSLDAVYDVCQLLRQSNLQLCQLIKQKKFNEHELYKHFKECARVLDDYSKLIEPDCSTTNTGSGILPNSPTDEMPPVKWNSDPRIFQQNIEEYEKKYRKNVHEKLRNLRKLHPDYLQFDGENDELIMKLIFVKRKYNEKTDDEIVDDLSKLRSAHPDYLKLDGQNDDLIKRFTKVFDKVAPKFSEKFRLKKICVY